MEEKMKKEEEYVVRFVPDTEDKFFAVIEETKDSNVVNPPMAFIDLHIKKPFVAIAVEYEGKCCLEIGPFSEAKEAYNFAAVQKSIYKKMGKLLTLRLSGYLVSLIEREVQGEEKEFIEKVGVLPKENEM